MASIEVAHSARFVGRYQAPIRYRDTINSPLQSPRRNSLEVSKQTSSKDIARLHGCLLQLLPPADLVDTTIAPSYESRETSGKTN